MTHTDPADTPDTFHLLQQLSLVLQTGGIAHPTTESELILAHVLGVSRGQVQARAVLKSEVTIQQWDHAQELAQERARRIPLQHLTGRAPFRTIELSVGPGVFVPRPETESVTQLAINALDNHPDTAPIVVDLCTGSGAIALAIATEVPTARVWAVEKSPEAHAWAHINVNRWGEGRVTLLLGDVHDPELLTELTGTVDVLVSNPPYVPENMVPCDPEVRDHDPKLALYGGSDGLEVIRVISRAAYELVRPGGHLVLEHAHTQGAQIRRLLTRDGWIATETHPDLTGRERATTAISPPIAPRHHGKTLKH